VLVPIVLLALSGAALVIGGAFGWALWRRRWLIADMPTSDAAHVFVGMNEVKGTVAPAGHPLVAPYTAIQCVWYRSLLEREEQSGDNKSWKTVEDVSSEAPFWIQDRSGHVLVRPKGASVYAREKVRDEHAGRPARYNSMSVLAAPAEDPGFLSRLFTGSQRYRTTEWVLRPDEPVYLLGSATMRTDAIALEFSPHHPVTGAKQGSLLISSGDESRAARRTLWQGIGLLLLAFAGAVTIPLEWQFLLEERSTSDDPFAEPATGQELFEAAQGGMRLVVLVFLLALPVITVVRIYNRLVEVRNRAEAAWSLVDVHLRRRHDLIPQLVAVVQAAAGHERVVQEAVAAVRGGADPPPSRALPDRETLDRAAAVDEVDRTASRSLLAVAEAYPVLLADESFAQLAEQITASEDGIAFARTFYNDAVTVMEDRRRQFPGALLARLVTLPTMARFEGDLPESRPAALDLE
jgi:LemA protein